jgi:hypothetical protein
MLHKSDWNTLSQWSFGFAAGRWVWIIQEPGGRREISAVLFETLTECLEDAAKHGYAG